MLKLTPAPALAKLVTFLPNRIEPIHNWYWYKEGFSRALVDWLINRFQIKQDQTVLDSFCGVGTTNLACKQRERQSIGLDASPLCVFVSKVKTADYDMAALGRAVTTALKWKFKAPKELPEQKYLRKALSRYALEDITFYKNKIAEFEDELVRNFLLLALLDSATKASWTVKDGALVRIVRKTAPPVSKLFKWKIRRMLKDLRAAKLKPVPTTIELGDARQLKLDSESIDAVITSPPYLNKIEYTKIYKLELMLFFGFPETQMRAYIGAEPKAADISTLGLTLTGHERLPPIAQAYFYDLALALRELHRVCKPGANLAIVLGGGCFPHRVVDTDTATAELAQQIGFDVRKILVARETWCTRARTIKVGKMRESVILLKK
jgi:SAM-dependent methyltransferase